MELVVEAFCECPVGASGTGGIWLSATAEAFTSAIDSFFGPLLPLTSNGPGAIVFILFRSPPFDAVLGLSGAYLGSPSGYC